jgi:type IV secretory pathway VirB2 component (pilin)
LPTSIVVDKDSGLKVQDNIASADDCVILSAVWSPAGEQSKSTFYRDGKTAANIVVKSKGCTDKSDITLTVFEADTCGINCDDALSDSNLLRRKLDIPTDNFTIRIKLGEEECEAGLSGGIGYDCDLFFYIRQGDTTLYNSWSQNSGQILYECDGLCLDNAKLLSITANGTNESPISVNPETETPVIDTTYKLLAPIGNLKEVKSSSGIGDYLNIMFRIAIGLCGALAVIMIVIGGIQYMGTESIFGKTEAKSKIFSAILGLFIALGAYAILTTINPALTGKEGIVVDQVTAEIDEEEETEPVTTYYQVTGTTKLCTTGYVDVTTFGDGTLKQPKKINICKSIGGVKTGENLQNMINAAKASNPSIILSGYGSRSYDRQVQLRKDHKCNPDIYTSPASSCKPPTARPGHSNHEVGGAVDFTCNGQSMVEAGGKNSVCFKWLSTNASKYGFKNLASESWHWSFNGK